MRRSNVDFSNRYGRNAGELIFCLQLTAQFDYREDGGLAKTYLNKMGEQQALAARKQLTEYLATPRPSGYPGRGRTTLPPGSTVGLTVSDRPVFYFSANHGAAQQTAYLMMQGVDEHFCFRELDAGAVGTSTGPVSVSAWLSKALSATAHKMSLIWLEHPSFEQKGYYCAVIETVEGLKAMAQALLDEDPAGYKVIEELKLQPGAIICIRDGMLQPILANTRRDSSTGLACVP